MSDILRGPSLTWKCRLAANGLAINIAALLDTGAAGEAFIHKKHFGFVKKRLQLYIRTAQKPVPLAGYNNQNTEVISRAFTANLVIDGRRILIHFRDTGRHNVLIGRKWFKKTRVLNDIELAWNQSRNPTINYTSHMI